MWLQRFTISILKYWLVSIPLVFVLAFIPIIGSSIGILIVALVTLCKGPLRGGVLLLATTLPVFEILLPSPGAAPLALWVGVGFSVISNVLTWGLAVMLWRKTSWSAMLQIATLVAALVISVIHLVYPDITTWWGNTLQYSYNQTLSMTGLLKDTAPKVMDKQLEAINIAKQYATGFILAAVLLIAFLQLIIARWWQAAVFKPGSLRWELHGIRLSFLAGALFVLSLVLAYFGNSVVLDVMPLLYLLFMAAGLSVIHYLFGLIKSPTAFFWITLFYLLFVFMAPLSILLVVLCGWMDIIFNIRKHYQNI